jgi:GNAT superfamily N-acetyltransferase
VGEQVQRKIQIATTAEEIDRCFPVMSQLRPLLVASEFVGVVQRQQAEGYQIAYLEHEGMIRSVAGFRLQNMLVSGRTFYVDDLVTDSNGRSQGLGAAMLEWLIALAREAGCASFSLDSGTHRQDAHAFYLRHRLRITSFHFNLPL